MFERYEVDGRTQQVIRRAVRRLSRDDGQSLVLALIIMSALTITIGALANLTTGNEHFAGRDRQDLRAFATAESGINDAISIINSTGYDGSDQQGPGTTFTNSIPASFEGATGSYTATKYTARDPQCKPAEGQTLNPCWVIQATATSSDHQLTRTLQETIYYNESVSDIPQVYNYGLFVDNGTGPCVATFGNPTMVVDNVFISGCFEPSGNTYIRPTANNTGSIYVGGLFEPNGPPTIGTPSYYYNTAHMHGCTGGTCGLPGSQVYATNVDSNGTQLQRPQMIPTSLYTYGKNDGQAGDPTVLSWNSHAAPSAGGVCDVPDAFQLDNNGVLDRSVTNAQLMPPGTEDFHCTVLNSDGQVVGSISRTNGVVDIEGTLFVDGDLSINTSGHYTGNGTIYVNGVVNDHGAPGGLYICGPEVTGTYPTPIADPCDPNLVWDPTQGQLVIGVINPLDVAPPASAFQVNSHGELDASLVVNQGYTDLGHLAVAGAVIADYATVGGSTGLVNVAGSFPASAPTQVIVNSGWTQQPGSWKELQ